MMDRARKCLVSLAATVTTALVAVCSLSCHQTAAKSSRTDTPDAGSDCLVGWWNDPNPWACACPGQPECQFADCQAYNLRGFFQDGTYQTMVVTVSRSANSFSTVGSALQGVYVTHDSLIDILVPKHTSVLNWPYSCGTSSMTLNLIGKVRSPENLAGSAGRLLASGRTSWNAQSYEGDE